MAILKLNRAAPKEIDNCLIRKPKSKEFISFDDDDISEEGQITQLNG